jgi:hypothetical protein
MSLPSKGYFQLRHFLRFRGRPRLKLTRQKRVHQLSVRLNDSEEQVFGLDRFLITQGEVPRAKDSELGFLCEAWEEATTSARVIGSEWPYRCAPATKAAVRWGWKCRWDGPFPRTGCNLHCRRYYDL